MTASAPTTSAPEQAERPPLLILEPSRGWRGFDWGEVWRARELLGFLVWRDLKVRYKQTALGVGWAILQPILTIALFALVFGHLGGLDRRVPVPYPVFACAGVVLWSYFALAVTQSAQSLVGSAALISKVYFPRLIIPFAAAGGGLVDLVVSMILLLGLAVGYGVLPGPRALALPLFAGMTIAAAAGVGAILAALAAVYRDFRHVIPFLVQTWMLASPVAYPIEAVPPRLRALYALNPMAGPIAGCRSALFGGAWPWDIVAISSVSIVVLFFAGAAYFRTVERRLADIL